jgi:aspartate/methionine/tyrosine aminotransferase
MSTHRRPRRLHAIPGIGVDKVGDAADALGDPELLRLENLDTDFPPPAVAVEATRAAAGRDDSNSYLPFQGHRSLRAAAAAHVGRVDGRTYDADTQCVSVAGGLNGVLNVLLATVEAGQEVVICDPIYAGLVNRIHLVGGVPRFVRSTATTHGWSTEPADLAAAIGPNTAAVLTMSPSMPTGACMGEAHWSAIAAAVNEHDVWVVHDAAMERLRFDGHPASPAAHPHLEHRTITVGSASKELRMIGWRVGWVVGPEAILRDVSLVGMANVVCQVGIAQQAVADVLSHPDLEADIGAFAAELRHRRDVVVEQLADYPCVRPDGGWSLLVDTDPLDLTPGEVAARLFERAKVAATPMNGWGPSGHHYLRVVFSNEPVERLGELRARFDAALRI